MPRLKNMLHERFSLAVAEGMNRTAAYAKLCPYVNNPAALGFKLFKRTDVKCRIAELQMQVESRALMPLEEKRDQLRRMIEGEIPTKVIKKANGEEERVYDRLAAINLDCRLAGQIDRPDGKEASPELTLTFEVYPRDGKFAPLEYLEREIIPEPSVKELEELARARREAWE